jgi:hypothetical protein
MWFILAGIPPYARDELLAHLLLIRKVPLSNISPEAGYQKLL